jgi:hypothetical protein
MRAQPSPKRNDGEELEVLPADPVCAGVDLDSPEEDYRPAFEAGWQMTRERGESTRAGQTTVNRLLEDGRPVVIPLVEEGVESPRFTVVQPIDLVVTRP